MFFHFKNTPLKINNNTVLANEAQISQDVGLSSPFKLDERVNDRYLPESSFVGRMNFKYYITGADFIKGYFGQPENQPLSGDFSNLLFTQGYLNSYSVQFSPNAPIEASVEISFFDKVSGTFTQQSPVSLTGKILNLTNCKLQNLSNYTTYPLTNITQANFSYQCDVTPSYKITDTGNLDTLNRANRVSIGEKTISMEVTSDATDLDVPISGSKFALIISGTNPNTLSSESWGCSGMVSSKNISVDSNSTHSQTLRITQNHLNIQGGISGVITGANIFTIYSQNNNSHPFTSNDNLLQYVDKITVGDVNCEDFTVTKNSTYDSIEVTKPYDLTNDILTVYATNNTYVRTTPITFDHSGITVNNLLTISGKAGSPYIISGDNFYRISNVTYGGVNSRFKVLNPRQIQSVIPYGGITNKLRVIAGRRNITGTSSNLFFCEPNLTTMTPVTGLWSATLTLGGLNLSGTTGVLFGGNQVPAFSYNVLSNVLMTVVTPLTGAGYPSGYIKVLTSGGTAQSLSRYNPHVPVYRFTPTSGVYGQNVTIYTKWDRDYLSISGARVNQLDGFKVRFGNVDTAFYISGSGASNLPYTGAITGVVPVNSFDDYIYLYQPNGTDTYTPNTGQFNVISDPVIYSFSPSNINQYSLFNATVFGRNLKYFYGQPFFFALSGGLNDDVHKYTNIMSNSGGAADTMFIPNVNITGGTGIYTAIVKNFAGVGILTGALNVFSGINRARFQPGCKASASEVSNQTSLLLRDTYPVGNIIDGNNKEVIITVSENGKFTNTEYPYAAIKCAAKASGTYFQLVPINENIIKLSLVKIYMWSGFKVLSSRTANPSGSLALFHKNASSPFYYSEIGNISGTSSFVPFIYDLSASGFTGIRTVRVYSTSGEGGASTNYLGISEIECY